MLEKIIKDLEKRVKDTKQEIKRLEKHETETGERLEISEVDMEETFLLNWEQLLLKLKNIKIEIHDKTRKRNIDL